MTALDEQIGGSHYRDMAIQPWIFNIINNIPTTESHIIEYICRWRKKGGILDLKKIQQYCQMLIEHEEMVESLKETVTCESCFDKHLLSRILGYTFIDCKCNCHEKSSYSCNKDFKKQCCEYYHSFSKNLILPYPTGPIKEFEETYHNQCVCECHKETKDV